MRGDKHVKKLVIFNNLGSGMSKLHAEPNRKRPANQTGHQRENQVQRPDILVVGRQEPAAEKSRRMIVIMRICISVSH